jgi:prevent-host-death family protein
MKTIPAGAFKAKCLALLDEVQSKRETVVITKQGKPVAQLVPLNMKPNNVFGFFAGKGEIVGDVVSPVLSPDEWGDLLA